MQPFKLVKDRTENPLGRCIYGQTAENDEYVLKWFYAFDYQEDRRAGKLQLRSFVCNLTAKDPNLLDVLYIPGTEPGIKLDSAGVGSISVNRVPTLKKALEIAAEAAELAVSYMEPYLK